MNQLKRYYNQNRKKIWGIIIIIAFLFVILQLANYMAKRQNEQTIQNAITKQQESYSNNTNTATQNNTQTNSNNETQTNNTMSKEDTIKQFLSYCNKKDIENAYNMLTNECKNELFTDVETFENLYYNSAFEKKVKDTQITHWAGNTYIVYFRDSALATGKETKETQKGDYITVVNDEEDGYKLNINSYVGYKELNKTKESEGLKTEVKNRNTYMKYDEYTIKVTNNSREDIILDNLENVESIYIEDSNGTKYPSISNELSKDILTISKGHTKELKIKFYSSYVSEKTIKKIVFSNLIKDNNQLKYTIEVE
ncbi:MAG: hypothetical protein IKF97_01400 [Clostridia bacterium]|nr:hypothetical protein [Clostridia bacterium]